MRGPAAEPRSRRGPSARSDAAPAASARAPAVNPVWHRLATSAGLLQAKLAVNAPGDAYEREADRVADQVLRMPDPAAPGVSAAPPSIQRLCSHCEEEGKVQRKCAHCEEEEKVQRALPKEEEEDKLKRKETAAGAGGSGGAGAVPTVSPRTESRIAALRSGGGQPLPPSLRSYFEPRFGRDLSAVRLHAGGDAAEAAREVRARAFTVGRDVAFGAGEYRPESAEGKRLLAHELAHTVQQGGAAGPLRRQPAPPPPPPPPTPTALPATTPTPGASDFKIERVGTSTQGEIFFARS